MKNKIIYFLLIVVVIEGLFLAFRPNLGSVRTDSGWDSDYSSSSSSDWSSSSSSDYSGSSGGSDEMTPAVSIFFEVFLTIFYSVGFSMLLGSKHKILSIILSIIRTASMIYAALNISMWLFLVSFILVFPLMFYSISVDEKRNKGKTNNASYKDISQDTLEKYGITDLEGLKHNLYNIFVEVQKAWMEFDYDALSKLCSNELYNSYKSDLETLKLKNGKNIMDSFKCMDVKVYNVFKTKDGYSLNVYMQVEFHDYVINTKTNDVIRGNKTKLFHNEYKLTFSKNTTNLDKCPSCGAPIKDTSNQKCEHCGNIIINNNTNYVLESKGRI